MITTTAAGAGSADHRNFEHPPSTCRRVFAFGDRPIMAQSAKLGGRLLEPLEVASHNAYLWSNPKEV
jgi:hypothetical protein